MGTYLKKYLEKDLCHENRHDYIQHYKGQSYNGSSLVLAKNPETNYEVVTFINAENTYIDDITSFEWNITGKGKDAKINVKFNNINEDILNGSFVLCFETNTFYKTFRVGSLLPKGFHKNKTINVFYQNNTESHPIGEKEGETYVYMNNIQTNTVYSFNIVDLFPKNFQRFINRKEEYFLRAYDKELPNDFEFHFNIRPTISSREGLKDTYRKCLTDYKTVKFLYKDIK